MAESFHCLRELSQLESAIFSTKCPLKTRVQRLLGFKVFIGSYPMQSAQSKKPNGRSLTIVIKLG